MVDYACKMLYNEFETDIIFGWTIFSDGACTYVTHVFYVIFLYDLLTVMLNMNNNCSSPTVLKEIHGAA